MKIKTLLLGTLLVSNVFAFEVSELPNITARETPDTREWMEAMRRWFPRTCLCVALTERFQDRYPGADRINASLVSRHLP